MDTLMTPEELLARAGGTAEKFSPPPPPRGRMFGRLRLLTLADARTSPPRRYLLHGLLAPGEMSLWWGAPKCGKSFLLLWIAYSLALGRSVWGRTTQACRVLYVAAEGEGGLALRLTALSDALGDAGDRFHYIAQRTTVGPPADDLSDVIEAAQAIGAEMIVLDTLARTFGDGDENTARDMGGFVKNVDRLRADTKAHVVVIHHGTKEGGSSRGSGALLGAADLIVKVTKGLNGEPSAATVEAAKDDADGAVLGFRLRAVEMTCGAETRITCIAEEAEGGGRQRKPLAQTARNALGYLSDLVIGEGQALPPSLPLPSGLKGVLEERWRAECASRRLSLAEKEKDRDRVFRRAAQELRDAGVIGMRDGWVWIARDGEAGGQG